MLPWLREKSRSLAALALFAMALQIVGSFGHLHLAHGPAWPAPKSGFIVKLSMPDVIVAAAEASPSVHKAMPASGTDGDVACAICLAGHLVASAVVASTPDLVLPIAYLLLGPPLVDASFKNVGGLTAFWSRGPPLF